MRVHSQLRQYHPDSRDRFRKSRTKCCELLAGSLCTLFLVSAVSLLSNDSLLSYSCLQSALCACLDNISCLSNFCSASVTRVCSTPAARTDNILGPVSRHLRTSHRSRPFLPYSAASRACSSAFERGSKNQPSRPSVMMCIVQKKFMF